MIRYAISLSLLVLILSASSSAQPSCERGFSAPTRIITAGGIPAAVYGDFNEDGQVDVAFTSTYRPTVALNRGNGVFEPIGAVQNFLDEPLIASADVTGDHHLDLVFGRYTVTWIARGRGDGTFTKPERVALFNATQSNGRLLDFDYDGILDVVEPGRDEVSFGRGRGNGTFEPFFRVEFEGTARLQRNQVTVGDFDGDGQIDALRTAQDLVTFKDRVSIVWSAATSARSQTDFTLSFPLINVTGTTVDLDGDGGDDLLALSNSGLLALRFPARQLAQQAIPFPSKPTQPPSRPLVVDINGDGLRDFIFQYGSSAAIARGSATGQFEEPKLFGLVGGGGFALAGIDGDGALDIATTAGEEGLSFIPGGRSLFDERPLRPILPLEFLSYQIQLADIDGDGLLDAVASDRGSMMVSVWLNRGAGKFKSIPAVRYAPQGYEGLGTRVFIADYDGDGRLDLAVSASEGTIAGPAIAFGNGDGTFTRVATELTGHFTGALRTSDLPGAAVLTIREGDLRAVRVSATGTVTTTTLFPAPEGTTVITFDLDDDGFQEIAVNQGSKVEIKRRSSGAWTTVATLPNAPRLTKIIARDVNGDLANDLLVISEEDAYLYFRDGSGYGERTPFDSWGFLDDVALEDVDGDSDADLILGTRQNYGDPGLIQVLKNDGLGRFETYMTSLSAAPSGRLVAGDIDGDGAVDLLRATFDGIEIERNVCATARVRIASQPDPVYAGHSVKLVVHVLSTDSFAVGGVSIYQDSKLVANVYPGLAFDYATAVWTSPPLAAGPHEFRIDYQDQFAALASSTVSIDVVDKPKRRRAVR